MNQQPTSTDRAGQALGMIMLLVIVLLGVGWLGAARDDMRRGVPAIDALTLSSTPYSATGSLSGDNSAILSRSVTDGLSNNPQPPAMLAGGAPITCTNGKTAQNLDCGYENSVLHIYPPASASAPCRQSDGQARLYYTDQAGQSQVTTGALTWDAARSLWAVAWAQGTVYLASLPACPGP